MSILIISMIVIIIVSTCSRLRSPILSVTSSSILFPSTSSPPSHQHACAFSQVSWRSSSQVSFATTAP